MLKQGAGVASTEDDIIRDEQERSNLLRAIADVETAIAVSTPGTRRVLENTLDNAKKRVGTLDKKIADAKVEQEAKRQATIAAASLVAKETALNSRERETYGGFLKEEFFTKKDFSKLEQFYAHTWDRLSEQGKEEMSHRIWEGVRHGEYRFSELPDAVKEKEAKLAYKKLTAPGVERDSGARIPDADRNDFMKAFESGRSEDAYRILDRDSFRQNISLETSMPIKHRAVTLDKAASDQAVLAENKSQQTDPSSKESSAMSEIKFDAASLDGVALSDAVAAPSAATMPSAAGARANVRQSV